MICDECETHEMTKGRTDAPLLALPTVLLVDLPCWKCECGNVEYIIPNMEGLKKVLKSHLLNKPELLTGAEFRFLRKDQGWSGVHTAKMAGYTPEHISRFENEKKPMPKLLDFWIRLIVRSNLPKIDDYEAFEKNMEELKATKSRAVHVRHEREQWMKVAA